MATTKRANPKSAGKRATRATSSKNGSEVKIRMYRQGLGDCFLLSFPTGGERPFYMLIDCGVVLGTADPQSRIGPVVDDIAKTTGGHIDVLVVTHEHWDHVSGFGQVKEKFDKLDIGQVWMGWTEDPNEHVGEQLRKERRAAEAALRMAVAHLGVTGDDDAAARVDSLVSFFGAKAGSTEEAMKYAKSRAPRKTPRYCDPAKPPIELDELPGVRFWVLGPPRDLKLLKKSNPSQGDAYGLDAGPGGAQLLLLHGLARRLGALPEHVGGEEDCFEHPFDNSFGIPWARCEHLPFFEQRYFNDDESWRRIDGDWMGGTEALALQLDSATNNTSLVLAIESTETGHVLLFPGDAQAGSWMSWQDLKWRIGKGDEKKVVTGPDLLKRTIFYKVGHHGSHNATLKAKGLELMVDNDLVAMIPVDHAMAVKKRWGKMPLPRLVDSIAERTHGRYVRIDDKATDGASLARSKPKGAEEGDWEAFCRHIDVSKLYFELSIPWGAAGKKGRARAAGA